MGFLINPRKWTSEFRYSPHFPSATGHVHGFLIEIHNGTGPVAGVFPWSVTVSHNNLERDSTVSRAIDFTARVDR